MRNFVALLLIAFVFIVGQISAQGLEFFDVDEYNKETKQKQQAQSTVDATAVVNNKAAVDGTASTATANAALAGAELDLTASNNSNSTSGGHEKKKKKKKNAALNNSTITSGEAVEFLNEASAVSLPADTSAAASATTATTGAAASTGAVDFLDLSTKTSSNNTSISPTPSTATTTPATESASGSNGAANGVQFMDLQQGSANTPTTIDKPKIVLITGITGLMGSNVARELVKDGNKQRYKVYGMIRQRSSLEFLSGIIQSVHLILGDITDSFRMLDVIQAVKPDIVFHFAAQSANALSFEHPQLTMSINVHGTLNLLEALRRADLINTRIFFPSSSSAYGNSGKLYSTGIPEIAKLDPMSPYGLSKATAEEIVLQYNRNYGMPVIVGRLFLYLGQSSTIMIDVQDFCRQIASIEAGIQTNPVVRATSNLQAVRDISDVRDFAEVIVKLIEVGKAGEIYNIGSGVGSKTEDLLKTLIVQSNMTDKITAQPSEKGASFKHERFMVANITKLVEATGYAPKYRLDETLRVELSHWRQTLKTLYNGFNPAQLNATFST